MSQPISPDVVTEFRVVWVVHPWNPWWNPANSCRGLTAEHGKPQRPSRAASELTKIFQVLLVILTELLAAI
jgi:hypothetical protein